MKRNLWEKLGDFVLGKGFYIVLFLCVATIGISGYYLIRSATTDPGLELEPVTGNPTVVLPDERTPSQSNTQKPTVITPPPVTTKPSAGSVSSDAKQQQTPESQQQTPPKTNLTQSAKAPAVYTWPVKGEVLKDFSLEALAYDETMGDWRTHSGIDIAAEKGLKVLCVSDGTVDAVYQDDLMGTTVVVDHGNGIVSTYSGLSEDPAVTVGQEVDTGTVLGTVGNTAIGESAVASHLHLEMTKDGVAVDPVSYLPSK